jgi:hypothetical protein
VEWSCLRNRFTTKGLRVPANAQLTPRARPRLARLVLEQGWIYTAVAKMFMVSPPHGREVGQPVPQRRTGRDGRSQLTAASQSDQDTAGHRNVGLARFELATL